jgi:hypothetical protein
MADFEVYVPRVRNDRGIIGLTSGDFLASDIRAINRALKEIDPALRTEFMREAKAVGQKAASLVKPALPPTAPLSGMNTNGRFGWNNQMTKKGRVAATKVAVNFRTSQGKNAKKMGLQTTSLVSVRVVAPMTAIADIAGRSGNQVGKGFEDSGYSKPYRDRYGNIRRHKLNGQGEAMIRELGGQASRYAWPSLIDRKNDLEQEVREIVKKWSIVANRRLS